VARLLLVEDARLVRRMLALFVEGLGHVVVAEAASGSEAVAAYVRESPDVVLLDAGLEAGTEAIAAILAHDPAARIVACASREQVEQMRLAIASGARRGVARPFELSELASAIEAV
jgi:two-component system chemotaxis response regulator CheY